MRCESCGTSMEKNADYGGRKVGNRYCARCADKTGSLLPRDEVKEQLAVALMRQRGGSRISIDRIVDAYMARMPAWRG